jgi:hypothetical protein
MNEELRRRMELHRDVMRSQLKALGPDLDATMEDHRQRVAWAEAFFEPVVCKAWAKARTTLWTYGYAVEDTLPSLDGTTIKGDLIVRTTTRRARAARVRLRGDKDGIQIRLRGAGTVDLPLLKDCTEEELLMVLLDLGTQAFKE